MVIWGPLEEDSLGGVSVGEAEEDKRKERVNALFFILLLCGNQSSRGGI